MLARLRPIWGERGRIWLGRVRPRLRRARPIIKQVWPTCVGCSPIPARNPTFVGRRKITQLLATSTDFKRHTHSLLPPSHSALPGHDYHVDPRRIESTAPQCAPRRSGPTNKKTPNPGRFRAPEGDLANIAKQGWCKTTPLPNADLRGILAKIGQRPKLATIAQHLPSSLEISR